MNFVIVLAAALLVVAAAAADKSAEWSELKTARKECFKEAGVEMPKGKKTTPAPEVKEKLKCLESCIMKKLGAINADGTFNAAKFPASHKEKAQKCFDANKDKEECERAKEIKKCMFKKNN